MLESSVMATPETRPQMTIRPAREADAATLREIFNQAVEDGLVTFETSPRSLEEQQPLIAAAEQDSRHPILVAEVRNWTCGVASLEPHDARHGLDDMADVQIFVHRSFRSYGVGRQLMREVQAEAARLGYRKLVGLRAGRQPGHLAALPGHRLADRRAPRAPRTPRRPLARRGDRRISRSSRHHHRVMTDSEYMRLALAEAQAAAVAGEVPVGAIIVCEDKVLARGGNRPIGNRDPTAHAEIVALRAAAQSAGNYRLPGATLYVTTEPCIMCAGASDSGAHRPPGVRLRRSQGRRGAVLLCRL